MYRKLTLVAVAAAVILAIAMLPADGTSADITGDFTYTTADGTSTTTSFDEAVENVLDGGTITLNDDCTLSAQYVISSTTAKQFTIDLNGHLIDTSATIVIGDADIGISVTLTDGSLTGAGTINGDDVPMGSPTVRVQTGSSLTMGGGTIESSKRTSLTVNEGATFVMTGGTVTGQYSPALLSMGDTTILGGTVSKPDTVTKSVISITYSTGFLTIGSASSDGPYIGTLNLTNSDSTVEMLSGTIGSVQGKTFSRESTFGCQFESDPSGCLPAGKVGVQYGEYWIVEDLPEELAAASLTRGEDIILYPLLGPAAADMQNGDTLRLLRAYEAAEPITVAVSYGTIDLNGFDFTNIDTSLSYGIKILPGEDPEVNTDPSRTVSITSSSEVTVTAYTPIQVSSGTMTNTVILEIADTVALNSTNDGNKVDLSLSARIPLGDKAREVIVDGGFYSTVDGTEYVFGTATAAIQMSDDSKATLLNDLYGIITLMPEAGEVWTLDLGGKVISADPESDGFGALNIRASDVDVVVTNGSLTSTKNCVCIGIPDAGQTGFSDIGVTLDGVTVLANGDYAVVTNGTSTGIDITITDSEIIATNGMAAYIPSDGNVSLTDTDVNGLQGIQFSGSGTLEVRGCEIFAIGDHTGDPSKPATTTDGAIDDGAAISVVSRGGGYQSDGQTANLIIDGGTYTSVSNAAVRTYRFANTGTSEAPVWSYGDASGLTSYIGSVDISSGTFTSGGNEAPVVSDTADMDAYSITGGTYSTAINDQLLETNFTLSYDESTRTYSVGTDAYFLMDGNYLMSWDEVVDNLVEGMRSGVTLLRDLDLGSDTITVPAGMAVALDLNGHSITSSAASGSNPDFVGTITNNGALNISDSVGRGSVVSTGGIAIVNGATGDLIIHGGSFRSTHTGSGYGYAMITLGKASIYGGTFSSSGYSGAGDNYMSAICARGTSADLLIAPSNGNTVTVTSATDYAVCNRADACVSILGGTFSCSGDRDDVMRIDGGTFSISGGLFSHRPNSDYIAEGCAIIDGTRYQVIELTPGEDAAVDNYDDLLSELDCDVSVSKTVTITGEELVIPYGQTVNVNPGITILIAENTKLTVDGIMDLNGHLTVEGTLDVGDEGFIENVLNVSVRNNGKIDALPALEGSTYVVTTPMQLQWIAYMVQNPDTIQSDTFVLGANITMPGVEFTPIGTSDNCFDGTFDGNGFTISNLSVDVSSNDRAGLFAYTEDATIRNLTLSGPKVTGGTGYLGILVGYSYGNLFVSDVHITEGSVSSSASYGVGGFVGFVSCEEGEEVEFVGCTISGTTITAHSNVGAFWGTSTRSNGHIGVYNSTMSGVTLTTNEQSGSGGLVAGYVNPADVTLIAVGIENCDLYTNGSSDSTILDNVATDSTVKDDQMNPEEYIAVKGDTGTWYGVSISTPVEAYVDDVPYISLSAALSNASAGQTVTLNADVAGSFDVPAGITLDLNGHKITGSGSAPALNIGTGNVATIFDGTWTDEGTVTAGTGQSAIVTETTLVIHGGTFNGKIEYTGNAQAPDIYGGVFSEDPSAFNIIGNYIAIKNYNGLWELVPSVTVKWEVQNPDDYRSGSIEIPMGGVIPSEDVPETPEDGNEYTYEWTLDGYEWDWTAEVDESITVICYRVYTTSIDADIDDPVAGDTVTLSPVTTVAENLYVSYTWVRLVDGEYVKCSEEETCTVTTSGTYCLSITVREYEDSDQIGYGTSEIEVSFSHVATVGDTEYATLQDAIDSADGYVIVLAEDVTGSVTVSTETVIDLNGHSMGTASVTSSLAVYGTGTVAGITLASTSAVAAVGSETTLGAAPSCGVGGYSVTSSAIEEGVQYSLVRNYTPPSGGGGSNPPQQPETPDTDIEEHPDGSTTETTTDTTTNQDGSTTETVTVVEKDPEGNVTGSTVTETTTSETEQDGVRETTSTTTTTTSDGDGNVTGSTTSSTVTTVTDTTTTVTEKEEISDAEGNITSSTEKVTETTRIDGGTMTTETTATTDSHGNTTTSESVTAESEDGNVTTTTDVRDEGTTVTTVISGSADIDDAIIGVAVSQSSAVSQQVTAENPDKVIQIGTDDDGAADVTLSPGSMSAIADTGAEFKVICGTGSMQLDSDVVSTLTEPQQDVTVRMSESDDSDLTDAQIQAKGDRFGVTMTATVGDQRYHLLGGTVTVTIPYSPSMGSDPSVLGVFYIDEDGVRTFMQSVFDSVMNAFVFQTDHFSLFVVDEAPASATMDDGDNTLLYVGIAVVVIVVIAIAAVAVRRH